MILLIIARVLISLIFLISGVNKILHWEGVEQGLAKTLCQWQIYTEGSSFIEEIFAFFLPLVPLLLVVATFFELAGGVMVIFRRSSRWGAVFLLIFLIPVTFVYHAFWFEIGDRVQQQAIKFLSNLAIMGGLLLLAASPLPKAQERNSPAKRSK